MNAKRTISILAAALSILTSCSPKEQEGRQGCGSYRISLLASIDGTKSGSFSEPVSINDFNLYFFSEGTLESQVFVEGSSETSVDLDRYGEYTVYAVANVGKTEVSEGISENTFLDTELEYSSLRDLDGIPCSYADECGTIVPERDIKDGMSISLTPMFARFILSIETKGGTPEGKLTIDDVSCYNINDKLSFFSDGDKAASVIAEGDFLSKQDIKKLSGGQEATFYAPENMQGTKAKTGNKKGSGGLCTFLVIEGTYESGLAEYDLDYVLYLGQDNDTSFDIERGATYSIKASIDLGDGHLLGMTPSKLEDYRNPEQKAYVQAAVKYFRWKDDSADIKPGDSKPVFFETNMNTSDISFSLEGDSAISTGAIDWKLSSIMISASKDAEQGSTAVLTGGNGSVWDTMEICTKSVTLVPSLTEMEVWGGNTYPVTFTLTGSGSGPTDVTSQVQCTSVSYDSSAPPGLLSWNGEGICAVDWWDMTGSWTEAPLSFTMSFSIDGASASVTGTMNGYTGIEFDRTDYCYSELEKKDYRCDAGKARLIGSETKDISTIATIVPHGDYMWDTNNGPACIMVGNGIPATVSFTDPSNGKKRNPAITLNVSSDVSRLYVSISPTITGGGGSGQAARLEATATSSGQHLGSAGIQHISGGQPPYSLAIIQSIYYIDVNGTKTYLTGSDGVGSSYVRVETSIGSPNGDHDDWADTMSWEMKTNLTRTLDPGQHDMIYLWVNGFETHWQWEIVN